MGTRLNYKPVKFNQRTVLSDRWYYLGMIRFFTRLPRLVTLMWRRWFGASYRPELHYMRGPGPKSRDSAGKENPKED